MMLKNLSLSAFLALSCMVVFSMTVPPQAHAATPQEYSVVLNLSGKQRMLTQKMSKEAALVALNFEAEKNAESLGKTVALFDKTLKGLMAGDTELGLVSVATPDIMTKLKEVETLWNELKPSFEAISAAKTATQEQMDLIAAKNVPLLKEMNRAVKMFEKDAKGGTMSGDPALATAINLAGKQRMLTQKMTKEALFIAYGHQVDQNKLKLLGTFSLFERTLKGLEAGDEALGLAGTENKSIIDQLDKVDGLWADYKVLMQEIANAGKADQTQIDAISKKNLPLLKEMNSAVKLFEGES